MSRSLAYDWTYDDATPFEAFRIRNRLEYLVEKAPALDQHGFKVLELRQRDDLFRCVTRMQVDTDLPGWARRFFQARTTVTQHELWHAPQPDGTRVYDIAAVVTGVPVHIRGRGIVSPEGWRGCRFDLSLVVTSRMPLFGARVEAIVAEQLERTVLGEAEFGRRWLGRTV
jgi:hypothetical protein